MSSCDGYSDTEPYSSGEDESECEYEIPLCFCGKDARLRIAGTQKNSGRRFFNCAKRKFTRQCGFFVWEDELFSDESGDESGDESSYICDECLGKERAIAEVESARDDCKASLDREKQPVVDKVKEEPLDQDGPTSNMPFLVKVKDEPLDQNGPANDMPLIVKVKDEPLDHDGLVINTLFNVKVKDEYLDQDGPVNHTPLIVKVKDEPLDQGGPANDGPLIEKVKDEPLDQDGDRSRDKAESVCVRCLTLKRRVGDIKSENKVSWDVGKVEMLTKLETAESDLFQIKKEAKDADDNLCLITFLLLNLNWVILVRKLNSLVRSIICLRLTWRMRLLNPK